MKNALTSLGVLGMVLAFAACAPQNDVPEQSPEEPAAPAEPQQEEAPETPQQ